MDRFVYLMIFSAFLVLPGGLWAQESGAKGKKTFDTVFSQVRKGDYRGTVNGVLVLEAQNGKQTILDFQGSKAGLRVVPDEDEVYDISYKKYAGFTTSGKTEVFYSTYAMGNEIGVVINNVEFSKNNTDGCSCELIKGINYRYIAEKGVEYLILNVNQSIPLSNWQYLLKTNPDPEGKYLAELKKKIQVFEIQPGSVVVFAIKRK